MDTSTPPITPQTWERVMKSDGLPVLSLSIRRPSFPDEGKLGRVDRYFAQMAQTWQERWETVLYPRACQALADARSSSRPFSPWRAELDYTVTLWRPPLLSLRLDATETTVSSKPLLQRMGETWDCASGYPRPLRSFFPPKAPRWRAGLLGSLKGQAEQRLASGESLLDPDCTRVMVRAFAPERFYLTEEGLAVFYPMYILGPYAEGIPVFTLPAAGWESSEPV